MVTKFSASEVRKKYELAQLRITQEKEREEAEERRLASERRRQAKEQALLRASWDAQKYLILNAALDGKHELEVIPPVYFYKELIESSIDVIETGLVAKQITQEEREKYAQVVSDSIRNSEMRIHLLLDKFIENHKKHLLPHYGNIKYMKSSLNEALDEAIESESSIFDGDENLWSSLSSPSEMTRYLPELREITKTIKSYKRILQESNLDPYSVDEIKGPSTELGYGDYFFSNDHKDTDKLFPSQKQNKLKIAWAKEPVNKFLNVSLFSGPGLTWLSSYYGQRLINVIFEAFKDAAEDGENQLTLKFNLTNDGWYFKSAVEYYCCVPDELVDIIEREGFTIIDTTSTEKSYSIKVSW